MMIRRAQVGSCTTLLIALLLSFPFFLFPFPIRCGSSIANFLVVLRRYLSEAISWDSYSWTASQPASLESASLISFCLLCNSALAWSVKWATFLWSFWAFASLIFPTNSSSSALNTNCFWLLLNLNFSACKSIFCFSSSLGFFALLFQTVFKICLEEREHFINPLRCGRICWRIVGNI